MPIEECCSSAELASLQSLLADCQDDIDYWMDEQAIVEAELATISALLAQLNQQRATLEILIGICQASLCPPSLMSGGEEDSGATFTDRKHLDELVHGVGELKVALQKLLQVRNRKKRR